MSTEAIRSLNKGERGKGKRNGTEERQRRSKDEICIFCLKMFLGVVFELLSFFLRKTYAL